MGNPPGFRLQHVRRIKHRLQADVGHGLKAELALETHDRLLGTAAQSGRNVAAGEEFWFGIHF